MQSIVQFTLRQQVFFNVLFVVITLVGLIVAGQLAVERYPPVQMGKAVIEVFYPGASPRDVEALVTRKLEDALDGMEKVDFVQASSVLERAQITVKFQEDSDYQALYEELRFRVLGIIGDLPAEIEPPVFNLLSIDDWVPVVALNLVGERSNHSLSLMAEQLQAAIRRIEGVSEARITGDWTREFHVLLAPERLAQHGVTFEAVATALVDANQVFPAGNHRDASGEYLISVDSRFRSREQVLSTVVRRNADGSFVRVSDLISQAGLAYRDPFVISSVNGQDTVAIAILKTEQGNALTIRAAVEEIINDFSSLLEREGVEAVLTQDSTDYINSAMSTLGWNLLVGMVLIGGVLWLVMGGRNAALVSIGLPFTFLATLIFMWLTGNSINEITLFSFVLVSGIIVDDAIVVLENIHRHLEEGKTVDEAIVDGVSEVMLPIISATATTIVAFLPMLIMTGSTGQFFAQIPKAISFALVASLLECLLVLPLHYRDFGPRQGQRAAGKHASAVFRWMRELIQRLLSIALNWRWSILSALLATFAAAVVILGASLSGAAPLLRVQFFPDDYNLYYAFVEAEPDTPLAEVDALVRAISRDIMADGPGFAASAAGFAGFVVDEDYEQQYGRYLGTVMVAMPTKDQRAFSDPLQHLEMISARLSERYANERVTLSVRAEKDGPPSGKDVNIQVVGQAEEVVHGLADAIHAALSEEATIAPYLQQLDAGRAVSTRLMRLQVDREAASVYDLSAGQVAALAGAALDGRYLGHYRDRDEELDLKLGVDPGTIATGQDGLRLALVEHPSGPVLLRDVVRLIEEQQPSELHRYQGARNRTVSANLTPGAPISSAYVTAWAQKRYQEIATQYLGASLIFGGEFEETQRSFDSLAQAFALAVLLIYLILAAQFKSYAQPFLVLLAVLFSVIGVVFGKFFSQSLFTINSFIAMVGVTGVVVNDSLVLLDFLNRGYRDGLDRAAAIRQAVDQRLRPILLTTVTTVLGLLPMALGIPSYSVIWGSMASTFVTGLATATILTLIVLPVAWDLFAELGERRALKTRGPE